MLYSSLTIINEMYKELLKLLLNIPNFTVNQFEMIFHHYFDVKGLKELENLKKSDS